MTILALLKPLGGLLRKHWAFCIFLLSALLNVGMFYYAKHEHDQAVKASLRAAGAVAQNVAKTNAAALQKQKQYYEAEILRLKARQALTDQAYDKLLEQSHAIKEKLDRRNQELETLYKTDKVVQSWADTRIPAAVKRMWDNNGHP